MKRLVDLVVAGVLLLVLAPVLAVIAVAIRLDSSGPALFRQERVGRARRSFRIVKFRTMLQDADRWLDEQGRPTRNRITRVGRLLRRTSLDELPQLFNVVKGDMSLIGPRPVLPERAERIGPAYELRYRARPGISGLAQVQGRNEVPWSRRLELDVDYVRRHSLVLDAWIAARTVGVLLRQRGIVIDRNPEEVDDL